jgi:hypothetical protein
MIWHGGTPTWLLLVLLLLLPAPKQQLLHTFTSHTSGHWPN